MKISKDTLDVLKNFASINSNIHFRQGNTLATVNAGKSILAKTTVSESFSKEFAVYDLNNFLANLSLQDDVDLEFKDEFVQFNLDSGVLEYYYSDPNIVKAAPENDIDVSSYFEFDLPANELSTIIRVAATTQAPKLSLVGDGSKVVLTVGDPETPRSNAYKKVVADSNLVFKAHVPVENLKLVPGDYTVAISNQRIMFCKSKTTDLRYWLALDKNSEF